MGFGKDEVIKMAKDNGLNIAEEALELAAKGLASMTLEMLAKFVDDGKIDWKDMIFAASEGSLKDLADKIEIKL